MNKTKISSVKRVVLATAMLLGCVAVAPAFAGSHVSLNVGIGLPAVGVGYYGGPAYYPAPAPVVYAAPAPVVYAPAPVVYGPPAAVVVGGSYYHGGHYYHPGYYHRGGYRYYGH